MFEKSKTPSFYPEAAIFCVENPRNTQVFLAVFSLKLTASGQKPVISSIFKQALRQHRTKTGLRPLHTICLIFFRHLALILLVNREIVCARFVQANEKIYCATRAQSLCGVALTLWFGQSPSDLCLYKAAGICYNIYVFLFGGQPAWRHVQNIPPTAWAL